MSADKSRFQALGRVAVDAFLRQVDDHACAVSEGQSWDEEPWRLGDLCDLPSFQHWVVALTESPAPPTEEDDWAVASLDHAWRNEEVREGLGWMGALLNHAFEGAVEDSAVEYINRRLLSEHDRSRFLGWCTGWLPRVLVKRDANLKAAREIAKVVRRRREVTDDVRPLVDWALGAATAFAGDWNTRVEVVVGLTAGGYRTHDCLSLLEHAAEVQAAYHEADSVWSKLAVKCALAVQDGTEQRFVSRIESPANRVLCDDNIAQVRGVPPGDRLVNLSAGPPVTECLDRLVDVAVDSMLALNEMTDEQLRVLGSALSRLALDRKRLEDALARALGRLVTDECQARLRAQCQELQVLGRQLVDGPWASHRELNAG